MVAPSYGGPSPNLT